MDIENRFCYTVTLSPALFTDALPLKWTLSKKEWKEICADVVSVHILPHDILALKSK